MKRRLILAVASTVAAIVTALGLEQSPRTVDVTFARDAAPVFFEHCVYCHRPGQPTPFSLMTYSDARPWARSIRQQVQLRRMPPWFLGSHDGSFQNVKPLTDAKVATVVAWVDNGAREGDRSAAPPAPRFGSGWEIGSPDLVVKLTEPYKIPASGTIPQVTLPTGYEFPEDAWVQAIEVRPGDRRVVHQALALMGSSGLATSIHLYAPGLGATVFRDGYARFIPRGTRIYLRMHYTAIGQNISDQSEVAFKFAAQPVHTEVRTGIADANAAAPSLLGSHDFATTFPLSQDARIHALRPHMSTRGSSATATLVLPDRSRQVLLTAAGWTDNWEYSYTFSKPREVPKGAALEYTSSPPATNAAAGSHLFYFDWTLVNAANAGDLEPIFVAPNPLFTTGDRSH